MSAPADLSLCRLLGSRVPSASCAEVDTWFADRAPLHVDHGALEAVLADWRADLPIDAEERARQAAAASLLVDAATRGASITFNALSRKKQGGRRYAFKVPGYSGPLILSQRGYKNLARPRVLLQAVPRALRPAVTPPPGLVFIDADIDRCFLAIAAALTGDVKLQADLADDIHQRVGDVLAAGAPADRRRKLGKLVNNALVGGQTAYGLRQTLDEAGVHTGAGAGVGYTTASKVRELWWARYPAFRDFVAELHGAVRGRAASRQGFHVEAPDGRVFRFDRHELRGWKKGNAPTDARLGIEAAARTVTSAVFRAIEGAILDRALQLMQPGSTQIGLRIAVPMYDGALFVVPADKAQERRALVSWAFRQALGDVGVVAGVSCDVRPRWGRQGRTTSQGAMTTSRARPA